MNMNLKGDLFPAGIDLQQNFLILKTGKCTLEPNRRI